MTKSRKFIIYSLSITLSFIIAAIIFVFCYKKSKEPYYLKSFENNVALYKGNRIVEIYDDININILTDYDRFLLRNGIIVENIEKVDEILEDYNS